MTAIFLHFFRLLFYAQDCCKKEEDVDKGFHCNMLLEDIFALNTILLLFTFLRHQ